MATIEAVAGNQAGIQEGAPKGNGKSPDLEGGGFMSVLMQLLGNDFSPEEIRKLEALVMGGMQKGKGGEAQKASGRNASGKIAESGDDASGEAAGGFQSLKAALDLIAGSGAGIASLKKGAPEATGNPVPEATALGAAKRGRKVSSVAGQKAAHGSAQKSAQESAQKSSDPLSREAVKQLQDKGPALAGAPLAAADQNHNTQKAGEKTGEVTIDLNALKELVGKESGANAEVSLDAGSAGAALLERLQQAIGEQLGPAVSKINGEAAADTVTLKIKDRGAEKKFEFRRNMLLAHHEMSGGTAGQEAAGQETAGQETAGIDEGAAAAAKEPASGGKTPAQVDLAQARFSNEKDSLSEEADPGGAAKPEKLLFKEIIREMTRPGAAGGTAGESEFSNVMVKYLAQGADGQVEKVFYKEIETPGADKKTLLIKTEVIRGGDPVEISLGETASAAGLTGSGSREGGDPEAVKSQAVIGQVAEGAESALKRDCSRVRLELNPPQLGTVDMDLLVSHDRVKMIILADSRDVQSILQGNLDQLRTSLEQQGLKMDGIDVFVQDRYAGAQDGPGGQARDGGFQGMYPGRESAPQAQPGAPEAETPLPGGYRPEGSGLSVFA